MARALAVLALALAACGGDAGTTRPGPNVLFVVWDTVRADRMSLYGHERETTPRLDRWAEGARVFEDCLSTAPITVSSHAAMFTGLLPTESGASNAHQWLDERHVTLAELFRDAGYRTWAWAANPHVSREENFAQGFEVVEHPWDEETREEAREIVARKLRPEENNELSGRIANEDVGSWAIKAAGELAQPALLDWLERSSGERPFFAFVNWMEAHRPLVPRRKHRVAMLGEERTRESYSLDLSWARTWAYTFGVEEVSARELELLGGVYDAAVRELDVLFAELLEALQAAGHLEDTVVVLTSDHGEHLGEHHMLDHQFTVHDVALRVPLVVHYPPAFAPGRDASPVSNHDVFPTLLELAGIDHPLPPRSGARSLLAPAAERPRLAEFTEPFAKPFELVESKHPDFDRTPWLGRRDAIVEGALALQRSPTGLTLYRAGEETSDPDARDRLAAALESWTSSLVPGERDAPSAASDEHGARLDGLGYAGDE